TASTNQGVAPGNTPEADQDDSTGITFSTDQAKTNPSKKRFVTDHTLRARAVLPRLFNFFL
ncbi:hypothetical protein, partial [Pseudomonas syringae]|uniref:hypothetical protein n=1 Tax=Pseudomonas syringae TaxID=317 RepID=UPI003CE8605F